MRFVSVLSSCLLAFALCAQPGAVGETSDAPKEPAKVTYYCPVVGIPDATRCPCSSGYYCSLQPKPGVTADYKGVKLQFCCGGCVKTFKENPAKFAVSANHQLIARKIATQQKCPLCGDKHDPGVTATIGGLKINLCSPECLKKFTDAKPADRVNLVFGDQAFARGFVVAAEAQKK
ncbi:MAG: hypothetical protein FJ303_11780 [Planctomycetes bacterium]|nr:hypothetical protein [Planctomycetota bacterium]